MSNCCIKERKEERKMKGPRGAWGGIRGPSAGPSGHLGASIATLSWPNCKPYGAPSGPLGVH
jgi:hypothetical protein